MLNEISYGDRTTVDPAIKTAAGNWGDRLLHRPYRFPAAGQSGRELSAYIEHAGAGHFFPLGTADAKAAAARAIRIHELVAKEGWNAAGKHYSRELIISFEWCMNPVLWTYTTIHTLVGKAGEHTGQPESVHNHKQHVIVVEADAGIRRALCWGIDRQDGFASIPCAGLEYCPHLLTLHKPRLIFFNRQLAGRTGFNGAGPAGWGQPGTPVVSYSAHADGDRMFAATPSGVGGYLIKRVKPNRLLEPILKATGTPGVTSQGLLLSVKYYFQELLQLQSGQDNANSALATLTQRERMTLELLSKGYVNKEIAQAMGISHWTVHNHIKKIFERLNVRTRTEAVIQYLEK